jgi:hypothetical protein
LWASPEVALGEVEAYSLCPEDNFNDLPKEPGFYVWEGICCGYTGGWCGSEPEEPEFRWEGEWRPADRDDFRDAGLTIPKPTERGRSEVRERIARGCRDCSTSDFEMYMVKDEVWAAAGMKTRVGILCLKCLSKRLGRKLTLDDFTDFAVNGWLRNLNEVKSYVEV